MEKKIIIFFCFWFLVSCSEKNKEGSSKNNEADVKTVLKPEPSGFCAKLTKNQELKTIPVQTVHWMYLDDSLKNICRALNFQLPWMESDIKIIPAMITPEILSLSPIKTFEVISKANEILNDSLNYFHYELMRDNCQCDVFRFYKGNTSEKDFTGFQITEQIICNAHNELTVATETKLKKFDKENKKDSLKQEVHGHDH